jgi:tRNA 2-thiouridine synthesizing protein A
MALIGAIREGSLDDAVEVLSSDERSKSDIPAWVAKAGHRLVEVDEWFGSVRFVVEKSR